MLSIKYNDLSNHRTSRSRDLRAAAPLGPKGQHVRYEGPVWPWPFNWKWCMTHLNVMGFIFCQIRNESEAWNTGQTWPNFQHLIWLWPLTFWPFDLKMNMLQAFHEMNVWNRYHENILIWTWQKSCHEQMDRQMEKAKTITELLATAKNYVSNKCTHSNKHFHDGNFPPTMQWPFIAPRFPATLT